MPSAGARKVTRRSLRARRRTASEMTGVAGTLACTSTGVSAAEAAIDGVIDGATWAEWAASARRAHPGAGSDPAEEAATSGEIDTEALMGVLLDTSVRSSNLDLEGPRVLFLGLLPSQTTPSTIVDLRRSDLGTLALICAAASL